MAPNARTRTHPHTLKHMLVCGGPPSRATLTHISFQKTFTLGAFLPPLSKWSHLLCIRCNLGPIYGSNSQTCAISTGRPNRLIGPRPGRIHLSFTVFALFMECSFHITAKKIKKSSTDSKKSPGNKKSTKRAASCTDCI